MSFNPITVTGSGLQEPDVMQHHISGYSIPIPSKKSFIRNLNIHGNGFQIIKKPLIRVKLLIMNMREKGRLILIKRE